MIIEDGKFVPEPFDVERDRFLAEYHFRCNDWLKRLNTLTHENWEMRQYIKRLEEAMQ